MVEEQIKSRLVLLTNSAICGRKKSRFIKNHEGTELLSNFGIKTPLGNVPLIGDVLFWGWKYCVSNKITRNVIKTCYFVLAISEMIKAVNKFLLTGDMPELLSLFIRQ